MKTLSRESIVQVLLDSHTMSFAHRLGIPIEDASATSLFRLLSASLLYEKGMAPEALLRTAEVFAEKNWIHPQFLFKSTFEERLNALEAADYVVFDARERYARWLGELADGVVSRYAGDLRVLRRSAREDPLTERRLLAGFNGMDDVKIDFFVREVQVAWCEQFPFVSGPALAAALQLNIGDGVEEVAALVPSLDLPRLCLALEQVESSCGYEEVRRKAAELAAVLR